ncbi:MAG: reverse transcriptase/maturase family protein [Candidatus Staskawiczbacteria bacterium]|nr:reverse transcriptase/maturase family protein [Candidatus Staskawiczbacteria bacterium]
MKILTHKYEDIISVENILEAWQEFLLGKRNKPDVQEFYLRLMDNVFDLHKDLTHHTYKHGGYQQFKINDPKSRTIHKASVRDRLLHHAVYRILYPFFDRTFIYDSFSCRNNKGTHKALSGLREFSNIVSKNNTRTCWILKCDIRKFFSSIDQNVLINILQQYIPDRDVIDLLEEIIFSFKPNGLPLGNLTSQLFSNVYMNEFDHFVKHKLKVKYYIRYADDSLFFSENKRDLEKIIPEIKCFLQDRLKLQIHPNKIYIKALHSGMDFLGWVNFKKHRVLRGTTKRRIFWKLKHNPNMETLNSYLGLLSHGKTKKIKDKVLKYYLEDY